MRDEISTKTRIERVHGFCQVILRIHPFINAVVSAGINIVEYQILIIKMYYVSSNSKQYVLARVEQNVSCGHFCIWFCCVSFTRNSQTAIRSHRK